jgi:hypothetical protein
MHNEFRTEGTSQSEMLQAGYPKNPLLHAPHFGREAASTLFGHDSQRSPLNWLMHEQLQPVSALPVTLEANPEQFAATVHLSTQIEPPPPPPPPPFTTLSYPAGHSAQSC